MMDHHGPNGMTNDPWRTPLPLTTRESITTRAGRGRKRRGMESGGSVAIMRGMGERGRVEEKKVRREVSWKRMDEIKERQ